MSPSRFTPTNPARPSGEPKGKESATSLGRENGQVAVKVERYWASRKGPGVEQAVRLAISHLEPHGLIGAGSRIDDPHDAPPARICERNRGGRWDNRLGFTM
jgi:hypothetical protein